MACPKWGQDVKIQRDNQWLLLLNIYNKKLSAFLCILALHFVLSKYIDGSLIITCHLNAPLCNAVSPRLAMYHTVAWQQGYHHQWPYQDYPTVQCHQHTSHLDMTHWNPNIQNISLNLLHIFPVKYQLKVDFIHEFQSIWFDTAKSDSLNLCKVWIYFFTKCSTFRYWCLINIVD